MPRFVLLYHECPPGYERPSHWDLMLEADGSLRTWAIPRLPVGWTAAQARTATAFPSCAAAANDQTVDATPLPDHRIDYLQAEGPLTGNRGEVHRVDAGTYETVVKNAQLWRVVLAGDVIQGEVTLRDSTLTL